MPVPVFKIISRDKDMEVMAGELSHFELAERGTIDPQVLATDMTWSLYCYDAETRHAVFVELPSEFDLADAAFSYVTQFAHAKQVALVPFDDLTAIANGAPCPDNVVMIYSIGRCGSTLVSKIFTKVPGVWSVSEPDTFTNLVRAGATQGVGERAFDAEDIPMLIRAAIRLAYRPTATKNHDTLVIKHRSQMSFFVEHMALAAPNTRNLFLYREPKGWADSMFRFAQKQGFQSDNMQREQLEFAWNMLANGTPTNTLLEIVDTPTFPTRIEEIFAAVWITNMRQYATATDLGMQFGIFSYAQLNNDREMSVARLLDVCGLDADHLNASLTAYDQHSQIGTAATSDKPTVPLAQKQLDRIEEIVQKSAGPETLAMLS